MTTDLVNPIETSSRIDRHCLTVLLTDALWRSSLALEIDVVLAGPNGNPALLVARDRGGQPWMVARSADKTAGFHWLCAPHSELAIRCVRSGRARPIDLFRHSRTGTVTVLSPDAEGGVAESVWLCADVDEDEFDPGARRVA